MGAKILAGRYELLGKKGDGGMAVVYKAKDRLLNRNVAIKILKPEYIKDPKFIDSFRRESQAAAGLSHPNIVSVYDVGKEGNIYYIVMEILDGDTLSDLIRRESQLPEKYVIGITKQIAAGLSSAHKKNIIHRDVKPHNILMAEDGTFKITDFGIAKAVNSGTIVNNTTTVMGSVHYLSPEQAKGSIVDARSDIYSLGIVMYEMLTGKVPYDGENAVTVAMMHMTKDLPAPSLDNPSVSPIMDAIVLKAASRHPGDRFKNADELIAALTNAANSIEAEESNYGLKEFYMVTHEPSDSVPLERFEDLEAMDMDDMMDYQPIDNNMIIEPETAAVVKNKNKNMKKNIKPEEAKEKKKKKRSMILGVILALICAIPLSVLMLNALGNGDNTVKIPDVKGMTEEQAADELEKYGLKYKVGTPVLSDEYDEGEVVSTDPDIGDKVRKGFTVTLVLSRGNNGSSSENKMPNLVGKKQSEIADLLKAYKLEEGKTTYEESDMPEGYILRHTPEAGEEIEEGTTVSFVVSKGKEEEETEEIKVPDLSGMTQSRAESTLKEHKLELGKVSTAESDKEEGTVIDQSRKVGSTAKEGDTVDITLSSGKAQETEENVDIPLSIDYGAAENEVFTLTVTVTDSNNGLRYIVNNQQRVKSNGSENVVLSGKGKGTVKVIMDDKVISEYNADFSTGEMSKK